MYNKGHSNSANGDIAQLLSMSFIMSRCVMTATLDLIESELVLFDPPTLKTHPRTKHGVELMTSCRDMTIQNITRVHLVSTFWGKGRS